MCQSCNLTDSIKHFFFYCDCIQRLCNVVKILSKNGFQFTLKLYYFRSSNRYSMPKKQCLTFVEPDNIFYKTIYLPV